MWPRHRDGRLPLRRRTATGRDRRRRKTTWRWWRCRLDCEWTLRTHVPVLITTRCHPAGIRIDRVSWMPNRRPRGTQTSSQRRCTLLSSSIRYYRYCPIVANADEDAFLLSSPNSFFFFLIRITCRYRSYSESVYLHISTTTRIIVL